MLMEIYAPFENYVVKTKKTKNTTFFLKSCPQFLQKASKEIFATIFEQVSHGKSFQAALAATPTVIRSLVNDTSIFTPK